MLEVVNVSVCVGSHSILKDICIKLNRGEMVVLLGANGAGKSTLFKTIAGLLKPANGVITFEGQRLDGLPPHLIARLGISLCPEGRKLFPQLSVYKNLLLGAYVRNMNRKLIAQGLDLVYELFPVLKEKEKDLACSLSGGQQQMLAIGRSLMSSPRLLLLDEPSLGLAPGVVQTIFEAIKKINEAGTTILLAEQNASAALRMCQRGYVLENGFVVLEGHRDDLYSNEEVKRAYLGA